MTFVFAKHVSMDLLVVTCSNTWKTEMVPEQNLEFEETYAMPLSSASASGKMVWIFGNNMMLNMYQSVTTDAEHNADACVLSILGHKLVV